MISVSNHGFLNTDIDVRIFSQNSWINVKISVAHEKRT